jgi:phosphopantothenoylcysteine decarboxylase/phosphopantothenate--cysteine ligase
LLVKAGVEVQVLMTESAADFIAPLTLSTLSKHPVLLSDVRSEAGWNNHVELGLWADALLIAPATANTLAKLANGLCDNILSAVYLSARCPVFVAPAMDVDMWRHPATQDNIRRLQAHGVRVIPVGHGELASGLVGRRAHGRTRSHRRVCYRKTLGRPPKSRCALKGKKALVTAGPTFEPLDPVRFIGNHSTGKMGIAIAETLAARGCRSHAGARPDMSGRNARILHTVVQVMSAKEMYEACAPFLPRRILPCWLRQWPITAPKHFPSENQKESTTN